MAHVVGRIRFLVALGAAVILAQRSSALPDVGPLIIGGENAPPGVWTWQAVIQYRNPFTHNYDPVCGAALITPQWLLTAAHCITDPFDPSRSKPGLYRVVLGAYDLSKPTGKEVIASPDYFSTHEKFTYNFNDGFPNDIGLIRLSSPVDLEAHGLKAIALPQSQEEEPDATCFITGWGDISPDESHPRYPNILQQAKGIITPLDVCRAEMKAQGSGAILDTHVCVGGPDEPTACRGDSGSPLSCMVKSGWQLSGVYSWYLTCEGLPSIYTRVSSYLDWIHTHMID